MNEVFLDSVGTVAWLVMFCLAVWALRRNKISPLAIQKFSVNERPRQQLDPVVEIVGRPRGLVAFLLTTMGFDATTRFSVSRSDIRCESTSLFGHKIQVIPMTRVATIQAGVRKPFGLLVFAAMGLLVGIYSVIAEGTLVVLAASIIVAAVLGVLYFFGKRFFLEVFSGGGPSILLSLRPSAIEGIPIDVAKALNAVTVICDTMSESHDGTSRLAATKSVARAEIPEDEAFDPSVYPDLINENEYVEQEDEFEEAEDAYAEPEVEYKQPEVVDQEEEAKLAFNSAKKLYKSGRESSAFETLRLLIADYPDTRAAKRARENLQKLASRVSRQQKLDTERHDG